jgi:hypothetical protein
LRALVPIDHLVRITSIVMRMTAIREEFRQLEFPHFGRQLPDAGQIAVSTLRGRPRMIAYEITESNRICAWNIMNIGWSPIVPQREFGRLVATREFPRSKAARVAQFLRPA